MRVLGVSQRIDPRRVDGPSNFLRRVANFVRVGSGGKGPPETRIDLLHRCRIGERIEPHRRHWMPDSAMRSAPLPIPSQSRTLRGSKVAVS